MSDSSSAPMNWPVPPPFTTAHTGYLASDVDRLIVTLEEAASRGEPLTPILKGRNLARISFGYDMDEVDAFLSQLGSDEHPEPSIVGSSPAPVPDSSVPVTTEESRALAIDQLLTHIDNARFRMTRRFVVGYEVGGVDAFLDELVTRVRAGESIVSTLRQVRFPMAPREADGYEVGDVDVFLDEFERIAGDDGAIVGRRDANVGTPPFHPQEVPPLHPQEVGSNWLAIAKPVAWAVGLAVIVWIVVLVL